VRILSVRQPLASLIVAGTKDVENRSWDTKYRGPVAIHAGKTKPSAATIERMKGFCKSLGLPFPDELPLGGIVGTVDLVGLLWNDGDEVSTDFDDLVDGDISQWFNDEDEDNIGFILRNARRCEFVPMVGRLGLWRPDPPPKLKYL